jgi:hypothetical protein
MYRLFFPQYKQETLNNTVPCELNLLNNKHYVYVGKNTNHIKLHHQLKISKNKSLLLKKLYQRISFQFKHQNKKRLTVNLFDAEKKKFSYYELHRREHKPSYL